MASRSAAVAHTVTRTTTHTSRPSASPPRRCPQTEPPPANQRSGSGPDPADPVHGPGEAFPRIRYFDLEIRLVGSHSRDTPLACPFFSVPAFGLSFAQGRRA